MKVTISGTAWQRWMDVTHADLQTNPNFITSVEHSIDPKMVAAPHRRRGKYGFSVELDLTRHEAESLASYFIEIGEAWPYIDVESRPEYRTLLRDGKRIKEQLAR